MMIQYCLPVIKNKKDQVLKTIEQSNTTYQYFEIWLDYIDDFDETFVEEIVEKINHKVILLFRRQYLEPIHLSLEKRKNILQRISGKNVYVDIDVLTQEEELAFLQNNNISVKTIFSYHNYQETPDKGILDEIIKKMEMYKPDIYKIATMCNKETDALQLLYMLLELKRDEKQYIVLGMGEKGIITRIFGTMWGNAITFAPKEKDTSSAPGQFTREQAETIFTILNHKY